MNISIYNTRKQKKINPSFIPIFICSFSILAIFFYSCDKDVGDIASIKTYEISGTTHSTATSGGYIINDGGSEVTARGVCWGTTIKPTIDSNHTADGTCKGKFISTITGLTIGKSYYVRAYAANKAGVAYGKAIAFIPNGEITDIDGNVYHTVEIGNQRWLKENLKTTRYKDGTPIPKVTDLTEWNNLTTAAYCEYYNDSANSATYGYLYNGNIVESTNICPDGFHVPTDEEWKTMEKSIGMLDMFLDWPDWRGLGMGIKLKEAGSEHWSASNSGNNGSGFTALPGGYRSAYAYEEKGNQGYWWTSSSEGSTKHWYRRLDSDNTSVFRQNWVNKYGLSIRCVND